MGALLAACGLALAGLPRPASAAWQTYHRVDGLAADRVQCVAQDSAGVMWFGTAAGPTRFDGREWRSYQLSDGLGELNCNTFLVDRAGRLWAGHDHGMSVFDGQRWSVPALPAALAATPVYSIAEDPQGRLWAATHVGLFYQSGGAWQQITAQSSAGGLLSDDVRRLVVDSRGRLLCATRGGASVLDLGALAWLPPLRTQADMDTWAVAEGPRGEVWVGLNGGGAWRFGAPRDTAGIRAGEDPPPGDVVNYIFADRAGYVWFATNHGLGRYDGRVMRHYSALSDPLDDRNIVWILEDRAGNLWLGTQSGAVRYDGSAWHKYETATLAPGSSAVLDVLADRTGRVWAGTDGGGLLVYDGDTCSAFKSVGVMGSSRVQVVYQRGGSPLWFGTDKGAVRWAPGVADARSWPGYCMSDRICEGVLPDPRVSAILVDPLDRTWIGTARGAARFGGGLPWTILTASPGDPIRQFAEAPDGGMWILSGRGLYRFDGEDSTRLRRFGASDSVPGDSVNVFLLDHRGVPWAGCMRGLFWFDGAYWHQPRLTGADGPQGQIRALFEDHAGGLWVGTDYGALVLDSTRAQAEAFRSTNGLVNENVVGFFEDSARTVWVQTRQGLSRFNGRTWKSYTVATGLLNTAESKAAGDLAGGLWFAGTDGLDRFEPDRTAPHTIFIATPPALSSARDVASVFGVAYADDPGAEFRYLDPITADTSAWSADPTWGRRGVPDGIYTLRVWARDWTGNVDPMPATWTFEVDGSVPEAVISSPQYGQAVRGGVVIRGTARHRRFRSWTLEVRPANGVWAALAAGTDSAADAALATWDTRAVPDGDYELRLTVENTLGTRGVGAATVIVDNLPPFVDVTSPRVVTANAGGDVYTTNREVHLYFPPHAFPADTVVEVDPDSLAGQNLPAGTQLLGAPWTVRWGRQALRKPASLAMLMPAGATVPGALVPAIFRAGGNPPGTWERLGGTLDPQARTVACLAQQSGTYALLAAPPVAGGAAGLSELRLSPRSLSRTGSSGGEGVAIGFTLGRPGPVTARIFARSGRLVRIVASGLRLPAGANLLHWDGLDQEGGMASDGIYIVAVESQGEVRKQVVAVSR